MKHREVLLTFEVPDAMAAKPDDAAGGFADAIDDWIKGKALVGTKVVGMVIDPNNVP